MEVTMTDKPIENPVEQEKDGKNPKEEKVEVRESRWHNVPALIGIALIVLPFTEYAFFAGAILILIAFWVYVPLSYQRDKDHFYFARTYEKGVYVCRYAFAIVIAAYSLMFLPRIFDLAILDLLIPWVLLALRYLLILPGLAFVIIEWADKVSPWLKWRVAPWMITYSKRRMPTKTVYLNIKSQPKNKVEPTGEEASESDIESENDPENVPETGRRRQLEKEFGQTRKPYVDEDNPDQQETGGAQSAVGI